MTLLCTYHHGLLHRGSFSIVRESDDTLRFVTADGHTIPRRGYRLEDFVDDEIGGESDDALDKTSRELACALRTRMDETGVEFSCCCRHRGRLSLGAG
jgi:hypothetical protein